MDNISLLIGGKAGFGIDKSGGIIGRIFNQLGYHIYIYRDYPSLIRGGHTFSIVRASGKRIATHLDKVDFILALNQDTINFHKDRLKESSIIIYDADSVKLEALPVKIKAVGLPIGRIIKEENASEIMRNTCIIGAFSKIIGLKWEILTNVFRKEISKGLDLNLKVAQRGFEAVGESMKIEPIARANLPILTGNQAIALGLIKGGLNTYIAYPMTPSSPILHFLAELADDFGLEVIHPESEIAVILMALGFSYMGKKVAVGTSGGGFCLMTEGLSLSGMAELPVVIVLGQRPGPSTGLPTYSTQSDLHFALNAGQGEFTRFVIAPGDAEEAYYWSGIAMNMSWRYQVPSIILSDKSLGEGVFNFDIGSAGNIKEEMPLSWDKSSPYKRYLYTENGVSPLAFVPEKDAIIKVNSYEHDEFGITTEEPETTIAMQNKRLGKEKYILQDMEKLEAVKTYGDKASSTAILCWGSNKGVCIEVAQNLGLKVIQPLALSPFPRRQFLEAVGSVKKIISVENNATGQLMRLVEPNGVRADKKILKYDGRPFSLDELETKIKAAL